ncbi:response regulator [Paraliomyxa miuraensis]|uniref:response regulator n=1 Tax=Paraliomyxa miuraensis TaxID=376150 RepID=UPI00224FB17C|nr:response regulator [Paraliomyxa miuraensis]MCX4244157.1 response regulator [Paraliomyxa miuraensis]
MSAPSTCKVLVVDDEKDVLLVTKLSLKGLRWKDTRVEFLMATSGAEAIEQMRANPDVAVILLDVVMETEHAGLDTCKAIREELDNRIVRVLLRTGQPGQAPEKQTIDEYDIDGYLPKAELTSSRLYSAVRTAIRAWEQLVELERHRQFLHAINDCAISLRTYDDVEVSLGRILDTVVTICPTHQAVLSLETFDADGNAQRIIIHQSTHPDSKTSEAEAIEVAQRLYLDPDAMSQETIGAVEGGLLLPIRLHRELGYGWIFMADVAPDDLVARVLPIMAAHAANALYGAVAQAMLAKRDGNLFDDIAI